MIWLCRLIFNARSREVRRDLADCHQLHRTVMAAFPQAGEEEPARERFGVLYRLERDRAGHPRLLVQSRVEPDWSRLPADYLAEPVACKRVDDAYDALQQGSALLFRLKANPTRKINTRSGPDGKRRNGTRVELHGEEEWLAWLGRQGERNGFRLLSVRASVTVPDVRTAAIERLTGRCRHSAEEAGEREARITLFAVLFEGRLVVSDGARFLATLNHGIGPGKAYGLGLLSVACCS